MITELWVWRYAWGAKVRHVVRRYPDPLATGLQSACGIGPWTATDWWGDQSPRQLRILAGLRVCRRCDAQLAGVLPDLPADVLKLASGEAS